MSSSSRPASRRSNQTGVIDKLDYRPGGRPLIPDSNTASAGGSRGQSAGPSYAGSFFEEIAEGVVSQDRERMKREVLRYTSFLWAIINCLGAGSITAFSLYGHLFLRGLHYNQLQVNGISITGELATYLPVPIWGYLCDRYGPGVPSVLAGVFFGVGYILAAFTYRSGPPVEAGGEGWPYWVMVVAFTFVGLGTACSYLSAVTTCAKNFGRGRYKGLALALPIAAFGLSGMWLSQVGSNLLYEVKPDGSKGDVDVYRFFIFLGCFLFASGIIGYFALQIVGEDELIEEAIEELERSGLLIDSEFFRSTPANQDQHDQRRYGALLGDDLTASTDDFDEYRRKAHEQESRRLEEERKNWLLNSETRLFLSDHTMWWLTAGFFLVTGPGESYINNLGTIIGTLYPPITSDTTHMTSAATHVSILAVTSTIARVLTGTLTDIFAPTSSPHQHVRGPQSMQNSITSLSDPYPSPEPRRRKLEISRISILIFFSLLLSLGQVVLASGAVQEHGERFWIVSSLIGAGYGAAFSLTPIIVSVIWGVENFGTNWGIVSTVPAVGATIWGLVYSGVYQWAATRTTVIDAGRGKEENLCYGMMCYAPTFWAMAACVWIACGMWLWAWRGHNGWASRGIAV